MKSAEWPFYTWQASWREKKEQYPVGSSEKQMGRRAAHFLKQSCSGKCEDEIAAFRDVKSVKILVFQGNPELSKALEHVFAIAL